VEIIISYKLLNLLSAWTRVFINMFKITIIALVLFFFIAVFIFLFRNPLDALPKTKEEISVIEGNSIYLESRIIRFYTIIDSNLGKISIAVSFPDPIPLDPLPVLFILGGLETGFDSVKYIPDIGNNILVGYDWLVNKSSLSGKKIFFDFPKIYSDVYKSPGQIAGALEWVSKQSWSDDKRINFLGFSLGAIVLPSAQHIIEEKKLVKIRKTVIAYGGAKIGLLLNSNKNFKPAWLKPFLGWIIQVLFNPLDPKEHLPYISGNFLLIGGSNDEFIPKESFALINNLTPNPKKTIILEGKHMGVGKNQKDLLNKIIKDTRMWLKEDKAINSRY